MKLEVTAYDIASHFLGIKEVSGQKDNPFIVWALSLCGLPDFHDETPWCSAFVNAITFILSIPRSKSAAARSWLRVGKEISLSGAEVGNDIVILKRGEGIQPGPEVLNAPGHVGFFAGVLPDIKKVRVLGGNQSNSVSFATFDEKNILGIRRLMG